MGSKNGLYKPFYKIMTDSARLMAERILKKIAWKIGIDPIHNPNSELRKILDKLPDMEAEFYKVQVTNDSR